MIESISVYRIEYTHGCGTGSDLIALKNRDSIDLACDELERINKGRSYYVQTISGPIMTPKLYTEPDYHTKGDKHE